MNQNGVVVVSPSFSNMSSISRLPFLFFTFGSLSILHETTSLRCGDNEGVACTCQIPDPSTILDGDRLFLGGRRCDEEMTMCDGTNTFWCEHGGKCEEIVQGEVYSCRCRTGYGGDHCELRGAPCGDIFCYRGAQCLVEGDNCECPVGWRGSQDCSLPTNHSDSPLALSPYHSGYSSFEETMLVMFLVLLCTGGAVWGLVKKQRWGTVRSQQLPQRSSYEMIATELETIGDDDLHHQ